MSQAHFSLSWDAHKNNICRGLSSLQQNGEFVDMTLAADGHMVKVHQMIIALASPYFKELILSAQCTHPVIFLNKVSYATLSSLLEYIYAGEVLVGREQINELVEAAKELRIRGLEDMKVELVNEEVNKKYQSRLIQKQGKAVINKQINAVSQIHAPRKYKTRSHEEKGKAFFAEKNDEVEDDHSLEVDESSHPIESDQEPIQDTQIESDQEPIQDTQTVEKALSSTNVLKDPNAIAARIQYTVTIQGGLSMILNRYLYYLKYTSRKTDRRQRTWRCVNCKKHLTRCPAGVITEDDIVVRRFGVHNHPFHDEKILKKVRDKAVFSTITDAEANCIEKKRHREEDKTESTPTKKNKTEADTTDCE